MSSTLNAQTLITWLTDDNRDLGDLLLDKSVSISTDSANLVLTALPQYKFDLQYASLARINNQLQNMHNACVGSRIKTEQRAKENIFSLPLNIHPSHRLYYLKDNVSIPAELLNAEGQLTSLQSLFEKLPSRVLGKAKGISFGKYLDQELEKVPFRNIAIRSGDDRYNAISRLFFNHRVDFILDFPTQVEDKIKQYRQSENIVALEIANNDNYVVAHIACHNGEVGKKFIEDANKVLKSLYENNRLYQAHIKHLPPSIHDSFSTFFQQTTRDATKVE